MNKLQYTLRSMAVGTVVVGPIVRYAFAVVKFGLGLVSSNEIIRYAGDVLILGAVVGFVLGLVSGLAQLTQKKAVFMGSLLCFVVSASVALVIGIPKIRFASTIGSIVVDAVEGGVMGGLIVYLTLLWQTQYGEALKS